MTIRSSQTLFEPNRFQAFAASWHAKKEALVSQIASDQIASSPTEVEDQLNHLKDRYVELLSLYDTLQIAYQDVQSNKTDGCQTTVKRIFNLSFADSAALAAGAGLALSAFFGQDSDSIDEKGELQQSTTVKAAAIGLIILSQIFSKWKDYSAVKQTKASLEVQKNLVEASRLIQDKGLLLTTQQLIARGDALLSTSLDDSARSSPREKSRTTDKQFQIKGSQAPASGDSPKVTADDLSHINFQTFSESFSDSMPSLKEDEKLASIQEEPELEAFTYDEDYHEKVSPLLSGWWQTLKEESLTTLLTELRAPNFQRSTVISMPLDAGPERLTSSDV